MAGVAVDMSEVRYFTLMRVLALDTTARRGSVAVVDDDRVIAEREGDATRTHAERLPRELLDVLEAADAPLETVDLFAVASGPGSFTGLRIGIAAMQGLALVTGRRVVPVSLLEALGHVAAHGRLPGALVAGWIDAHRRDVFAAAYRVVASGGGAMPRLAEVEPPRVDRPENVLRDWADRARDPVAIAGDGAVLYRDTIGGTSEVVPPPPMAGVIGRLAGIRAANGGSVSPAAVQPLYVRQPDAEIARDQKLS
jgi:tRNA threonylcarbamoyladenosine biosynthesis protein TsaB